MAGTEPWRGSGNRYELDGARAVSKDLVPVLFVEMSIGLVWLASWLACHIIWVQPLRSLLSYVQFTVCTFTICTVHCTWTVALQLYLGDALSGGRGTRAN